MKEEIEAIASWFSVLVAASYAFTIGYLDVLKVPEIPSPLEAFLFYFRSTLLSGGGWESFGLIFVPLILILFFLRFVKMIGALTCCATGIKKIIKDVVLICAGVALIWGWCAMCFNQGRESLNKPTAGSFFPEAYTSTNNTKTKAYRLVWIADGKYFWLDCDPHQPQLMGVENDKEFFIRRLGTGSIKTICSPS